MTVAVSRSFDTPAEASALAIRLVLAGRTVILRIVRVVLGAEDPDEEDLVQTSVEKWWVLAMATRDRDNRRLLQLAAVIARNVAIDARRQRTRARRICGPEADGPEDDPSEAAGVDVERVIIARENLEWLGRTLQSMRPALSTVMYMHDVLGHELDEIAEALGISGSAAQSRLVRARRRLTTRPWAAANGYNGSRRESADRGAIVTDSMGGPDGGRVATGSPSGAEVSRKKGVCK
ncbi:MAG: RNA polymerase sigma factor [Myxococcales bacterium]|nr:RNA polymerase sigma factor [Myxococcales bacterium]